MQNVAVFEELSVYENIDYFCGLYIPEKSKRKNWWRKRLCLQDLKNI